MSSALEMRKSEKSQSAEEANDGRPMMIFRIMKKINSEQTIVGMPAFERSASK